MPTRPAGTPDEDAPSEPPAGEAPVRASDLERTDPDDSGLDDALEIPVPREDWDEEWLPTWVNLEDEPVRAEDPESERTLVADLQEVDRLVASLLTESAAAFEASVGNWQPDDVVDDADETVAVGDAEDGYADADADDDADAEDEYDAEAGPADLPVDIAADREPEPELEPQPVVVPTPPPASVPPVRHVVSPVVRRRRRRGAWLVAPLVLLAIGGVIGTFLWIGAAGRPTPAAAVQAEPDATAPGGLPSWTPEGSAPATSTAVPSPVTSAAASTSVPVPVPRVHRPARRVAHAGATHAAPVPAAAPSTTAASVPVAPSSTAGTSASGGATGSTASSSCPSGGPTETSTPTQTTTSEPTSTTTGTPPETTPPTATETTSAPSTTQVPVQPGEGCTG